MPTNEPQAKSYQCPICSTPLLHKPRYPRYVCSDCVKRASTAQGRKLTFSNLSFSGGFEARFADTDRRYPQHECFIDGIRCWADEARFGGIVVQVSDSDQRA